jgi:hypothetical protein
LTGAGRIGKLTGKIDTCNIPGADISHADRKEVFRIRSSNLFLRE